MTFGLPKFLGGLAAAFLTIAISAAAVAETVVGKSVESRVLVAFKVEDAAAQSFLPDDWKLLTLPKGPFAGSNLIISFNDRHLVMDAEGKPADPYAGRSVALLAYGVKKDVPGASVFVLRDFETPPGADNYGTGVVADISRMSQLQGPSGGAKTQTENWSVKPSSGGEIALDLTYTTGRPGWSRDEAQPKSAANPGFFRIYRYDQLGDLAMSAAMERDFNGEITVTSTVPELDGIFDGSEQITAILVRPVYVREISLP